jgi:hypothetical protein
MKLDNVLPWPTFNFQLRAPRFFMASAGAILAGDFLDPLGTIQMNHAVLDGRLFGGDSSDMQRRPRSDEQPTEFLLIGM